MKADLLSVGTGAPGGAMPISAVRDLGLVPIARLVARFGLRLVPLPPGSPIPGSYWGAPEAGLIGHCLYVRGDTPVHSALHEACHFVCMDEARRGTLERDAGGEVAEENAVCYLQVLLADELPGFCRQRLWADMDAWGYSFRLDSACAWFEQDAEDARQWLRDQGLIDGRERPTWRVRQ